MRRGDAEPVLLVDPNTLSEDGTVALMTQSYTKDGSLLAYSLSQSGSDWQRIKILDVDANRHLEEELTYTKFPNVAWGKEGQGFYYNRLPDPDSVATEDQNNFRYAAWHTLGTPQADDLKIFQHEDKTLGVLPLVTEDPNTWCCGSTAAPTTATACITARWRKRASLYACSRLRKLNSSLLAAMGIPSLS
jgi:prolyl oligopeptidase